MTINKYLPIGSVVLLKGAKKRVIIVGLFQTIDGGDNRYDYSACVYPVGVIDSNNMLAFNHEDIDVVYAYGYQDDEYFVMNKKILENSDDK